MAENETLKQYKGTVEIPDSGTFSIKGISIRKRFLNQYGETELVVYISDFQVNTLVREHKKISLYIRLLLKNGSITKRHLHHSYNMRDKYECLETEVISNSIN